MRLFFEIRIIIFSFFFLFHSGCKTIQNEKDIDSTKFNAVSSKIDSRDFTFIPSFAIPADGGAIKLSGTFSFIVSKDSIYSDLPYFGRAYVATLPPVESGFRFTCKKFDYEIEKYASGWKINLLTLDGKQKYDFLFDIKKNGYTSLVIRQSSRQSITFYGDIN